MSYRSWALWFLGYLEAALADTDYALKDARDIGQAATLMYAQAHALWPQLWSRNYIAANTLLEEGVALADEKGALHWKALGTIGRGCLLATTGNAWNAVQMITSGNAAYRSIGAKVWMPLILPYLARAYAELGQHDESWRCIGEAMTAMETTKERWCEADIHRLAGDIVLMSPKPDPAKAEAYFERSLEIALARQAKFWELRTAMSMARLWRDQGKRQRAHDLLAPIYGWFTEGFDTLDLKEAKALLDQLAQ